MSRIKLPLDADWPTAGVSLGLRDPERTVNREKTPNPEETVNDILGGRKPAREGVTINVENKATPWCESISIGSIARSERSRRKL